MHTCFSRAPLGVLSMLVSLIASAGFTASRTLAAEDVYPAKPVKFIVTSLPGSAVDIVGRAVATEMSRAAGSGQAFIVENKAGANGFIATEQVARSAADGYTALLTTNSHIANKFLFRTIPYDPIRDFKSVTLLKKVSPLVLVVGANSEFRTLADVTRKARQSPGKLSYGSGNSSSRVGAEMYKQLIGADILYVPYKGNPEALNDVAAGRVDMMFSDSVSFIPLMRAGRLRALVSTAPDKPPQLPDVPTSAEAGMSALDIGSWTMVVLPAQTSDAIAEKLNFIIRAALRTETVKQIFYLGNSEAFGTTRAELDQFLSVELAKWGDAIRKAGILPE